MQIQLDQAATEVRKAKKTVDAFIKEEEKKRNKDEQERKEVQKRNEKLEKDIRVESEKKAKEMMEEMKQKMKEEGIVGAANGGDDSGGGDAMFDEIRRQQDLELADAARGGRCRTGRGCGSSRRR